MIFNCHHIRPLRYHLGNSQISFRRLSSASELEFGQVTQVLFSEEVQRYYFFVQPFAPLRKEDKNRDPYKKLDLSGPRLVYQAVLPEIIIEEGMIEGQVSTMKFTSSESTTLHDTLCVVPINFNVSFLLTLSNFFQPETEKFPTFFETG